MFKGLFKKSAVPPVEIVAIIDRSGSMDSIRSDAIGGFNAFITEQQKLPGEANLTLLVFNEVSTLVYESKPIAEVEPLTQESYVPNGMTALNDAISRGISLLEVRAPERAIVVILTDGAENASRETSVAQVKAKITACEARGWGVVFLAANQDAFATAASYGTANAANFTASGVGVRSAMNTATLSVSDYRDGGRGAVDDIVSSTIAPTIYDTGSCSSDSSSSSDSGSSSCD